MKLPNIFNSFTIWNAIFGSAAWIFAANVLSVSDDLGFIERHSPELAAIFLLGGMILLLLGVLVLDMVVLNEKCNQMVKSNKK